MLLRRLFPFYEGYEGYKTIRGGFFMSMDKVELLKDKIIEYLKQGYSMSKTEKLLGLTRNDIPRYFQKVTGINPKELIKQARREQFLKNIQDPKLREMVSNEAQEDRPSNKIQEIDKLKELENRIIALENKLKKKTLDLKAIKQFSNERVTLTFRIPKDLRDMIKQEANNLNISINDFVIVLLANYFNS